MLIMTSADLIDIDHKIKSADSAIHYYFTYQDMVDAACLDENGIKFCDIRLVGDFSKNRNYPAAIYNMPAEWN